MDLVRAHFLTSTAGRAALASLPRELEAEAPHRRIGALRRRFTDPEASALSEQLELRSRARTKLGDAEGWVLSRDGFEMMTAPAVARRRAARVRALDLPFADLTCGIGGDLRAVDEAGVAAFGFDRDPAAALLARANAPHAGIACADASRPAVVLEGFAVMVDPARRHPGRARTLAPEAFSPPFDVATALAREGAAGVVKTSPGFDRGLAPPNAELEFVQLGRDLRECALWFGRGTSPGLRRAVLLPAGAELASDGPEAPPEPVPLGALLHDPESCVTRAGLVRQLAAELEARLVDPYLAYLTSEAAADSALCASFTVIDVIPFSLHRVRARLRERGWRPDEIRRRAFPMEPDDLRRQLGHLEGEPVTLFATTILGERVIIVGRRLPLRRAGPAER